MVSILKRNRKLKNEDDIFNHNAWDDVEWTTEMIHEAENRIQQQKGESQEKSETFIADNIEPEVSESWNKFYDAHGDKFFKDRKWIFSEFPEIIANLKSNLKPINILEIGCGVGNAIVNILEVNCNEKLHVYCCDIASNAIETLKKREFYKHNESKITAFQADICTDFGSRISSLIQKESLNFITVIFTLSALKPELMKKTIADLTTLLTPGGMILFRDYAQYDMTQLRFKAKSYLKDNYYIRSDGTTSYFFTKELVDDIFTSAGLKQIELKEDNRMLINRSKSLKMCRRWIQAKYEKVTIAQQ